MIVRVKEFKGYGLLYYLDDEDEVYSDEFRVLVSKKGKCGWKRGICDSWLFLSFELWI